MTVFDGEGLAKHAEKALSEKWFYLWGAFGQRATAAFIEQNARQYPENRGWAEYLKKAVAGGGRVCDCYGLVKSYLWWGGDGANPNYCAAQDVNTLAAYNAATEKGSVANMPEIAGLVLYMPGHVGIYTGGGRIVECAGGGVGAARGEIKDGKVVKGSKFLYWFKDKNITYKEKAVAAGVKVVIKAGAVYGGAAFGKKVPASVCGKVYSVVKTQKNAGRDEALLAEINSWVGTADLTVI